VVPLDAVLSDNSAELAQSGTWPRPGRPFRLGTDQ
jgi:hypothetical protein